MARERKKTRQEEFLQIFADDIANTLKAYQLYDALCNNRWTKKDVVFDFSWRAAGEFIASIRNEIGLEKEEEDRCQRCHKLLDDHFLLPQENYISRTLRSEGREEEADAARIIFRFCQEDGQEMFLSGYLGAEDYIDYYCSGSEGQVADWIKDKFTAAGFKHSLYAAAKAAGG